MATPKNCAVLLAEDDRIDAKAFLRTVASLGVPAEVTVARDGVEAWDLLTAPGAPAPDLAVLDINMPRLSGLELLEKIRGNETLRHLRVYVLTTSDAGADRRGADARGASGYIVKSDLANGLRAALQSARPAA